jgi:predicted peptidase
MDVLVMETIRELETAFPIDAKRRYVMGTSGGGFGSWYFTGTYPDVFAAAIPRCGGGDPDLGANMAGVAVWAFHGDKDPMVPVSGSRDMIQTIKQAGGNPRYTEFAGAGHDIEKEFQNTPGVLNWLFAQKHQ